MSHQSVFSLKITRPIPVIFEPLHSQEEPGNKANSWSCLGVWMLYKGCGLKCRSVVFFLGETLLPL